ncbi:hypothetical protein BKA70DRAFT_754698 [Coprinopsis sp. MPI-PUGE-AT-0042]|nr:hypothetical protein BKA70DRAFT_754698 [Coprinopsis sp. MPI-PUGE-AT-0042]
MDPSSHILPLPTEILSFILRLVTDSEESPADLLQKATHLLQLSLVCNQWYTLIYGEPHFWSSCSTCLGSHERSTRRTQESDVTADQTRLNALEAFYSRSGSSLPLRITVIYQSTPANPAIASRFADFFISKAHRWTTVSLMFHELVGDRQGSWLYSLMKLASREMKRLGSSPFKNVENLSLTVSHSIGRRSFPRPNSVLPIDISSLALSSFFPNISTLAFRLQGRVVHEPEALSNLFSFQKLVNLKIFIGPSDSALRFGLKHLLKHLPALKRLEVWGLTPDYPDLPTHPTLESFITSDERIYLCGPLSFPSLHTLALGDLGLDPLGFETGIATLKATLSFTYLRRLVLQRTRFQEVGLGDALRCVQATLQSLVLFVPLDCWDSATGELFTNPTSPQAGAEYSSSATSPLLFPQLSEVLMHADELPETQEKGSGEYDGFCAFRDAFIRFVDDTRRWKNTNTNPLDGTKYLEVAHFGYLGGVFYHRGRDVEDPTKEFRLDDY